MGKAQKQMLCLSVHSRDCDPFIRFEREDYYFDPERQIYTERMTDGRAHHFLVEDDAFLEKVGFSVALGIFSRRALCDGHGQSWALFLYPHERHGREVLRMDEEPYTVKPERLFCEDLALPGIDMGRAHSDEDLKRLIARTVLDYLPLDVEHDGT